MEQVFDLFTYSPEPLGEDEIRLIDIVPGTGDDVIQCKLCTYKRSDNLQYKALSYAWGDVAKTCAILVDGKICWLHTNLQQALFAVREEDETIRLWTDRICINQEDPIEKNSQVRNMGKTYSRAEEVVVWLGFAPFWGGFFQALHHINEHYREFTDEDWEAQWPHIATILHCPWFDRLWVIQEVGLAGTVTVIFGNERCDLQLLLDFRPILRERVRHWIPGDRAERVSGATAAAYLGLDAINVVRQLISNPEPCSQEMLVYECRGKRCHDPRDYIFATTGIAEHLDIPYHEVSYELSTREVFLRFTKHILLKDASALLQRCRASTASDLPTWVDDLSTRKANYTYTEFFSAGGVNRNLELSSENFEHDSSILKLTGFVFDEVSLSRESVHHRWTADELRYTESVYVPNPGVSSPYGDYLSQLQAFWRTLIGNRCSTLDESGMYFEYSTWPAVDPGVAYEIYIGRAEPLAFRPFANNAPESNRLPLVEELRRSLVDFSSRMSLILSKDGYFATGPLGTRPGDLIVVISGLDMPLILRQGIVTGRYEYVGPAYIHGIMFGEFIEELEKNHKLEDTTTFEIE